MWLTTPESIEHVLLEQPLEPMRIDIPGTSVDERQRWGEKLTSPEGLRAMPVVAIGQPETWSLQDLYKPNEVPRLIQIKLKEADFYLVRLSCSFRPVHNEYSIMWARFRAALLPHSASEQLVAFDIYPEQVVQEVKRQIKVTLSPQLKFKEVEASLGSAESGFDYSELVPQVSAAIGAGFDPSWDYQPSSGQALQGTKWMHVLVKAPKGMTSGRVLLELEAEVQTAKVRILSTLSPKKVSKQPATPLTCSLWG